MASTTAATFLCLSLFLAVNLPIASAIGPCDVVLPLIPCVGTVLTQTPSMMCCNGAALVAGERITRAGRVVVCECLRTLLLPLTTPEAAQQVLRACNVALPIPDSNANCFLGV